MAPSRNQQTSKPSAPPPPSAHVPTLSSHQNFPSSSQTVLEEINPVSQVEEVQSSVETLQQEMHQVIANQHSLQNQISAQIYGSAISYGVYFYSATKGSLTTLSSLTFLTPMFASIFGFLYLGETFSPLQLAGAMITIAAIYLVNYRTIVE